MLGSIAQDSKRKERYVKVLYGCRKQSGTICVAVENSKKEIYRVTLFPNGTSACRHEVNGRHEPCPARGRCYHIRAVSLIASLFTDEGYLSKEQAPKDMQYYYHDDEPTAPEQQYNVVREATKVVADAQIGDAYERMNKRPVRATTIAERGSLSSNRGFSLMR